MPSFLLSVAVGDEINPIYKYILKIKDGRMPISRGMARWMFSCGATWLHRHSLNNEKDFDT